MTPEQIDAHASDLIYQARLKSKTLADYARAVIAAARQPAAMDLERALAINRDLVGVKMHTMDLQEDCPDLKGYSLEEMLQATRTVREAGGIRQADGTVRYSTVCDERLVAALYVWAHWRGDPLDELEPIVRGQGRAVLVAKVAEP